MRVTSPTLSSSKGPEVNSPSSDSRKIEGVGETGSLLALKAKRTAMVTHSSASSPPLEPRKVELDRKIEEERKAQEAQKKMEEAQEQQKQELQREETNLVMLILDNKECSAHHIHQLLKKAAEYRQLNQLKRSHEYYGQCMRSYDIHAEDHPPRFAIFCNRRAIRLAQGDYKQAEKEHINAERYFPGSKRTIKKIMRRGKNSYLMGLDLFGENQKLPYQKQNEIDAYKIVEGAVVESLRVVREGYFYLNLAYLAFILTPAGSDQVDFFKFLVTAEMFSQDEVVALCKKDNDAMVTRCLKKDEVSNIVSKLALQLFAQPNAVKTEAEIERIQSRTCVVM